MADFSLRIGSHAPFLPHCDVTRWSTPRSSACAVVAVAGFHPPYAAGESRKNYDRAMAAVGPHFAPILRHVVIEDQSAASWAEKQNRKGRSLSAAVGMERLRLALNALVRH